MRIGLIARAEDRGLGHLTWDFYRAMRPERTVVVSMGPLARGFGMHLDRYPDADVAEYVGPHFADLDALRRWAKGLDVVYSAETFYDPALIPALDEVGVATVCHIMPEFFKWVTEPYLPKPTAWWNPTSWRRDVLPSSVRYVPIPVPPDVPVVVPLVVDDRRERPMPTFVHVAGHAAMRDRNGTATMCRALRHVTRPMRVRIVTQDDRLPGEGAWAPCVEVEIVRGGYVDRWDLYRGADVIVMPRRYGGLCLPVQEAMACGVVPMMPTCSPNYAEWPILNLACVERGSVETGGGRIPIFDVDPRVIAREMDSWCATPEMARLVRRVDVADWLKQHSWDELGGLYMAEFDLACRSL